MIGYPWYHWKRYFGKMEPMELITIQIQDSLLKLHAAKIMQHQYSNEVRYQEELLNLLYKEKEYYAGIPNAAANSGLDNYLPTGEYSPKGNSLPG
jgi:hypothetical protein